MIQVLMPKAIKGELCSDEMSGTEVEVRGVKYVVHELLGKGDMGVTRKCIDDIGGEFAIKFVAPQAYKGRSYLAEVAKARKLRNCPNIARLEGWDTKEIELPHSKRRESFVCFITEYVKGDVLQDYLCGRPISPSFLKAFVDGLCEALHTMRYHGLHHNDMHSRNIMICAVPEESLDQEGKILKVIDTGLVVNNVRFLILPWVRIPNFASFILSRGVKTMIRDWEHFYGVKPVLLETFVDKGRFKGTCYRAANWIHVGSTKGYARRGYSYYNHQVPKDIYIYPLHTNALEFLRS